jgi:hypothetical protein
LAGCCKRQPQPCLATCKGMHTGSAVCTCNRWTVSGYPAAVTARPLRLASCVSGIARLVMVIAANNIKARVCTSASQVSAGEECGSGMYVHHESRRRLLLQDDCGASRAVLPHSRQRLGGPHQRSRCVCTSNGFQNGVDGLSSEGTNCAKDSGVTPKYLSPTDQSSQHS